MCWCSGALWGLWGPRQPLTRTAVLQVQSLSRAWQFPLLWGPLARGAQSANNNNIQHAGQGSDTNGDPPHHSTRTWTGARTQPHCSLGEQGGVEDVGLWVAGAFGLLSLPATTTILGVGGGFEERIDMQGGVVNLICVDCICRWHDGLDLKMWRLNDKCRV